MPRNPPHQSSRGGHAATPDTERGRLTVVMGCMFSGKTTELIRRVEAAPPGRAVAVKHATDVRYAVARIVSHAGKAIDAVVVSRAGQVLEALTNDTQLVAIDEGHFFDEGVLEVAERTTQRGIDVVVAALQLDSWGRPFPLVERLWARADEPVLETAICARCRGVADRTQRLTPVVNGQMVVPAEEYEPRCRDCWVPPREVSFP